MDGNRVIIKLFFQPVAQPTAGQPGRQRDRLQVFRWIRGGRHSVKQKSDSVFALTRNKHKQACQVSSGHDTLQ